MSVGFVGLHQLLPACERLRMAPKARVLLLGTQDLHFTYDQAAAFFTRHDFAFNAIPEDQRRTTKGFGFVGNWAWAQHRHFMHHETLFAMLGLAPEQIDVVDLSAFEGANIVHDLNKPMEGHGPYDLILDQGTMEHIFDVRQVLFTLSALTKVGGEVIHMSPAGFLNHGFYNFNATLFEDFYGQSGWEKAELYYSLSPKSTAVDSQVLYGKIEPDALQTIPPAYNLNVFARFRRTPGSAPVAPTQGFYKELHAREVTRPAGDEAGAPPRPPTWAEAVLARRAYELALEGLARLGAETLCLEPPPEPPALDLRTIELDPARIFSQDGATFAAALPDTPRGDDNEAISRSNLVLFEDGVPLGPAHAMHADIAGFGGGAFSHWHDYLFFSTSDGSSPLDNGRVYSVSYPADW